MSLVFAAITPHSPVLLPTISQKTQTKLKKTQAAITNLEEELYLSKPNIIIVISPHASLYEDAFIVNAHTQFESKLAEFGDVTTKKSWPGCPDFAAKLAHAAHVSNMPLRLVSEDVVDYGASIPLLLLTNHLDKVKVLPLGFSDLSSKEHLSFGELIHEQVMQTNRRIAVIASADLAHTLTKDAPAGFHKNGEKFDKTLIKLLEARNTAGISTLDQTVVKTSEQCGYRSILILLGVLKNMNYSFKNYCYEAPFGVGYLTGNFVF